MPTPLFNVEEDGEHVHIRNVPIFQAHKDRGYHCDEEWLDRCVADFWSQKAEAAALGGMMLPCITIGHTPSNPDAPEPPAAGFLDNLRRIGRHLYADFVHVPKTIWSEIKANKYPYRSAEVIPQKCRLTNVSLLGGRYPHFPLPIMRFMQDGQEVIRYTMGSTPMSRMQQSPMGMNGMGGGMGGGMQGGGGMGGGGMGGDIEQLAAAVAPIVMTLMTQQQANMIPGAMMGAYNEQAKPNRHSDDMGHTTETADAAEDDDVKPKKNEATPDFDGNEQGMKGEDFGGSGQKDKAKFSQDQLVQRYAALESSVKTLTETNESLRGQIAELQKHNMAQAQTAKRTMLVSKCKEIAAQGYAIGNVEQINKHVDRMMVMDTDNIKSYFEDVLRQMPKVPTGNTSQRYGAADYIERPGADEVDRGTDNLGLDRHTLELGDALGEM